MDAQEETVSVSLTERELRVINEATKDWSTENPDLAAPLAMVGVKVRAALEHFLHA